MITDDTSVGGEVSNCTSLRFETIYVKENITNSLSFITFSNYLAGLTNIPYKETKVKDVVISRNSHKVSTKIFSQSSLPIKRDSKPQMKSNYRPNTYINNNYRNKF